MTQLVHFQIGNQAFACEIDYIREVIRLPEITPVPGSPKFLGGVFHLRGQILPVIDLFSYMNLAPLQASAERVVIALIEDMFIGLRVCKVHSTLHVDPEKIDFTPKLVDSLIDRQFIKGLIHTEKSNNLIVLLDIPSLFSHKTLKKLKEKMKDSVS